MIRILIVLFLFSAVTYSAGSVHVVIDGQIKSQHLYAFVQYGVIVAYIYNIVCQASCRCAKKVSLQEVG